MLLKFKKLFFFLLIPIIAHGTASSNESEAFAPNVNMNTGAISVPKNYTKWATLGTWSHANTKGEPGAKEFHIVYTQPETIDFYQKHKRFPDGAVLVKELLNTKTMGMTTGPATSHATTLKGWFVLVRDTKNRFKESKLWGDGWGRSFFSADNPIKTSSTDYQTDCIACHVPARELAPQNADESDKWIYTFGYPVFK